MTDFAQRRMTMVDTQVRPNDVTKFPIIEAMLAIPREAFVPEARREAAYVGENLDLGAGRVLLEPRTMAKMLDALDIQPGERVLDVGAGLGYSTAVIARISDDVTGLEEAGDLAQAASAAVACAAEVVAGPLAGGVAARAPFDVIIVQGGVEVLPEALVGQLADGGRIAAIFMSGALGQCRIGHKSVSGMTWRFAFNATAPVLPGFEAKRGFAL
ncbi:MAG: hypothetical protein RLZZ528_1662 [Pseudomonadota bacterium]|jgi:protein-L-isoaspartate(D-aspartate) O-methyltransferase